MAAWYHHNHSAFTATAHESKNMPEPNDRNVLTHPSYATVSLGRIPFGTSKSLFQSDFEHHQTVTLEIHTAEVLRTNSEDHVMSKDRLILVEMSPLQLADLLTGFGATGPVPATLRFVVGDRVTRPDPPPRNVASDFSDEHRQALDDIIASVDELIRHPNLSVAARRKAQGIKSALVNRLPFVAQQFEKHVQHTVADARASITAYAEQREQHAGRSALNSASANTPSQPTTQNQLDPAPD